MPSESTTDIGKIQGVCIVLEGDTRLNPTARPKLPFVLRSSVTAKVKMHGSALEHAAPELQANEKIVAAAMKQHARRSS